MRKEKLITRTIVSTTATVLAMNITTATAETKELTLIGTIAESDLLKKLQKKFDTDTFKLVAVTSSKQVEKLYGVTEEQFLSIAKELPPRVKSEQEEQEENQ